MHTRIEYARSSTCRHKTAGRHCRPISNTPKPRGAYRRTQHLPGLIGLWPREVEDESLSGTEKIACKLHEALRAERRRGVAAHWTYDINRHIALLQAYRAECALVRDLRGRPE